LGEGSSESVRKAVYKNTKKEYAIKMWNLELESKKNLADAEKDRLEVLKGFSR
jgi:serine/threonine protein kinase